MRLHKKNWLFALLLTSPMIIFFMGYLFNHEPSLSPTGFIQYDNVSYVAYAKQYVDADNFSFFYSNPFDASPDQPNIYFQPQTIFFALLLELGIPPGWILIPFTFLCSLLCFRLLIAIYDHLFPNGKHRSLSIWLFAWGGGLLALAGFWGQQFYPAEVNSIFFFDPGGGWWGLNLGRSLFFSCEAWYHALFLGIIVSVLKHRWTVAIILSAVLSLSHPFTGLELLCITATWSFIERIVLKNKKIPAGFVAGSILLMVFHLYYYLYYLNQFDDHRSVSGQYELNWRLRFFSMIPAYCIAGFLALFSLLKIAEPKKWFYQSSNRLFLCWFMIALALANHELFMKPMQPLHFTRGYIWTSLFLLGLPCLHFIVDKCRTSLTRKIALVLFVILFLSDNILWIYFQTSTTAKEPSVPYIHKEQKQILSAIDERADNKTLIISTDEIIPYLATVSSQASPWVSHPFTTPYAKEKRETLNRFMKEGIADPAWNGKKLILVFSKNDSLEAKRASALPFATYPVIETTSYLVVATKK